MILTCTIALFALCVALVYTLREQENAIDYWRAQALRLHEQLAAKEQDKHALYKDSLRIAGELHERRRWIRAAMEPGEN